MDENFAKKLRHLRKYPHDLKTDAEHCIQTPTWSKQVSISSEKKNWKNAADYHIFISHNVTHHFIQDLPVNTCPLCSQRWFREKIMYICLLNLPFQQTHLVEGMKMTHLKFYYIFTHLYWFMQSNSEALMMHPFDVTVWLIWWPGEIYLFSCNV